MVTRVQHGTAEHLTIAAQYAAGNLGQGPAPDAPSTRVHTGAISITAGDQEARSSGSVTRHSVSFGGTPGGSVAATLQNVNGRQTVELIPGNPATRTDIRAAVRDGLVQRGAGGRWEDASGKDAAVQAMQQPQQAPEEAPQIAPEDAAIFDPAVDAQWDADIASIPQGAYDSAVASTIGMLVNGGNVDSTARNLAEAAGLEPADAEALLDAGYSFYGNQVTAALAPLGIAGDRLDQFIDGLSKRQGAYQDAVQKLVYSRDLSGFRTAAVEFLRHNPGPEVDGFKAAGFETTQDVHTGETLLRRAGSSHWVTMAQLAKV